MAIPLSHGYLKPQNPDNGSTFWNALATDIQLMNDHIHDGTLGTVLPTVTQSILSANWVAVGAQPGTYSQTVTMPAALSFDSCDVSFRLSNGTKISPTVVRVDASHYTIYTNDNSQTFTAVYFS